MGQDDEGVIGRRGSQPKGVARRQEILDRAIEVFRERGAHGTSLRKIAEAIGVSHAALLHYFDSRDGSEGTLALITEATLTIDLLPVERGCVLLLFDSLDKAANAALEIARLKPAACDLMDRRHLNLARETDIRYELLIPGEAEAVLLVEHHGRRLDGPALLRHRRYLDGGMAEVAAQHAQAAVAAEGLGDAAQHVRIGALARNARARHAPTLLPD